MSGGEQTLLTNICVVVGPDPLTQKWNRSWWWHSTSQTSEFDGEGEKENDRAIVLRRTMFPVAAFIYAVRTNGAPAYALYVACIHVCVLVRVMHARVVGSCLHKRVHMSLFPPHPLGRRCVSRC
jgi:hypothetical protein